MLAALAGVPNDRNKPIAITPTRAPCFESKSAFGAARAAGGGADGIDGHGQDGDGVGAGGGHADQAVSNQRGHEGHPQRAARIQVGRAVVYIFLFSRSLV